MLNTLKKSLNKFHNDEAGLEALQVVMIVAIAAVVPDHRQAEVPGSSRLVQTSKLTKS